MRKRDVMYYSERYRLAWLQWERVNSLPSTSYRVVFWI